MLIVNGVSVRPACAGEPDQQRHYPPLLPAGLHRADLAGVHGLCVEYFPGSVHRPRLMATLSQLVGLVQDSSIPAALWIGGSFMTEAPDPDAFDITMVLVEPVYRRISPAQADLFDWIRSASLFERHGVNTYGIVIDGDRPDGDLLLRYWLGQYGLDRPGNGAGLIEVIVPSPTA